jgi:hypothetical protein
MLFLLGDRVRLEFRHEDIPYYPGTIVATSVLKKDDEDQGFAVEFDNADKLWDDEWFMDHVFDSCCAINFHKVNSLHIKNEFTSNHKYHIEYIDGLIGRGVCYWFSPNVLESDVVAKVNSNPDRGGLRYL